MSSSPGESNNAADKGGAKNDGEQPVGQRINTVARGAWPDLSRQLLRLSCAPMKGVEGVTRLETVLYDPDQNGLSI